MRSRRIKDDLVEIGILITSSCVSAFLFVLALPGCGYLAPLQAVFLSLGAALTIPVVLSLAMIITKRN